MTEQELKDWAKTNGKRVVSLMKDGNVLARSVVDSAQLWLAIPDGFTHWFLEEAIDAFEKENPVNR